MIRRYGVTDPGEQICYRVGHHCCDILLVFNTVPVNGLPTSLDNPGNFTLQGAGSKAYPAHAEFSQERPGPSTYVAPVVLSYLKLRCPFTFGN